MQRAEDCGLGAPRPIICSLAKGHGGAPEAQTSLLNYKFSARLTSLSDLILRKIRYISGLQGRNAGSFMDSDSSLANSKGLSVKGPSKNFSPCSSTSRLTRREAAPAASFTRAESQELAEGRLRRLGPLCSLCQKVAH